MFSEVISGTPFTSEDAGYLFGDKIPSLSILGDATLTATMRAIIAPRMPEGRKLTTAYLQFDRIESGLGYVLDKNAATTSDMFYIINVSPFSSEKRNEMMRYVKETFVGEYDEYEELKVVEGFFAKSFPALCFVNRTIRTTVLFVSRMDIRKLHYIQTALLVMLPWYHGSRETVSEDELNLIKSFRNTDSADYMFYLKKLSSKYDFRGQRILRLMSGFETKADRARIETVRADITRTDNDISLYSERIADCMRNRNNLLITLMGLETKIATYTDSGSEFVGYLLRNSRVNICSADNSGFVVMLSDYLSYYDEDLIERNLNNDRGAIYEAAPSTDAYEDMKKLMSRIFLDKDIKIRVSAAYRIDTGVGVAGMRGYRYEDTFDSSMPNPHIDAYACLGQYATTLSQLARENDYIGIIDQCLASVRSLNWGDSPVMHHFASYMYNDSYRCIELPDGRVVFPSKAIDWIKEQEQTVLRAAELRQICFEEDFDEDVDDEAEEEE